MFYSFIFLHPVIPILYLLYVKESIMAGKKKSSEPEYDKIIVAIDEKVEENLTEALVDGIMKGLEQSVFGHLSIDHNDTPAQKTESVNDMFPRQRRKSFGIDDYDEDDFDYFYGSRFRPVNKAKVTRALNGGKDIYTGVVDFEMVDQTIYDIYNNMLQKMEESDKKNFKVIQELIIDI